MQRKTREISQVACVVVTLKTQVAIAAYKSHTTLIRSWHLILAEYVLTDYFFIYLIEAAASIVQHSKNSDSIPSLRTVCYSFFC